MLKDHTIDKDFKIYSKEKSTESGIVGFKFRYKGYGYIKGNK